MFKFYKQLPLEILKYLYTYKKYTITHTYTYNVIIPLQYNTYNIMYNVNVSM